MSNKGLMKILTLLIESCALKSYRSEERMTPQELISWAFALLILTIAIACTIVVGYVTFKVLCAIKEKGLQAIVDWFVNS